MNKEFVQRFLMWVFENHPGGFEWISLNQTVSSLARKNDKRPAKLEFFCMDEWTKNIKGDAKLTDVYVALRVPRECLDEWTEKVAPPLPPSSPEEAAPPSAAEGESAPA